MLFSCTAVSDSGAGWFVKTLRVFLFFRLSAEKTEHRGKRCPLTEGWEPCPRPRCAVELGLPEKSGPTRVSGFTGLVGTTKSSDAPICLPLFEGKISIFLRTAPFLKRYEPVTDSLFIMISSRLYGCSPCTKKNCLQE